VAGTASGASDGTAGTSRAERAAARQARLAQAAEGREPEPEVRADKRALDAATASAPRFPATLDEAMEATRPRPMHGDRVKVTIGKMMFCPVKYQGYEVGPLSLEVEVQDGEDYLAAYNRARLLLTVMFEAEHELQRKEFDAHVERR
jgi:hypothetical protein